MDAVFLCAGEKSLILLRTILKKVTIDRYLVVYDGKFHSYLLGMNYILFNKSWFCSNSFDLTSSTVIVALDWNYFIDNSITEKYNCFNLHYSYLPSYRGPLPLVFQIINGEKQGGVTLHKVSGHFDSGEIVYQKYYTINESDNLEKIWIKVLRTSVEILLLFFRNYPNISYTVQDEKNATYYSKKQLDNYVIDENTSYEMFIRIVKAFKGFIPIKIIYRNKIMVLKNISLEESQSVRYPYQLLDKLIFVELENIEN